MAQQPIEDIETLKSELIGLLQYVPRVRDENTAIHHPADEEHQITILGEKLDAIVMAPKNATNTFMKSIEKATDLPDSIRDGLTKEQKKVVDQIVDNTNNFFEACSFQDITGQRASTVMKSITYVENP